MRWHRWNEADGKPGPPIKSLPAAAELSGDGNWATVWKRDENGDLHPAATFVRVATADDHRKARRRRRPPAHLSSRTTEGGKSGKGAK